MTRNAFVHLVAGLTFVLGGLGCAAGQAMADDVDAQIEALRASLEKYQDYQVAVRDLYLSTVACVRCAERCQSRFGRENRELKIF